MSISQPNQPFSLLTSLRYDTLLLTRSWNTWRGNPSPFFLLPYHLERLVKGARDFGWVEALEALGMAIEGEHQESRDEARHEFANGKYEYAPALERLRTLCQDCVDWYFTEHPRSDVDQPLKIRITLTPTGNLHANASPTPLRPYDILATSTFDPSPLTALTINSMSDPATLDLSTLLLPPFVSPFFRVLLDSQATPSSPFTSHKTTARTHYDAARARASIPSLSSSTSPSTFTPPPTEILLHTPGSGITALVSEGSLRNVAFYRRNCWTTPPLSTGCLPGTVRRLLIEQGIVVEGAVPRSEVRVGEWVMLCNGVEGCSLGVVVGVVAVGKEGGEGG